MKTPNTFADIQETSLCGYSQIFYIENVHSVSERLFLFWSEIMPNYSLPNNISITGIASLQKIQ